MTDRGSSTTRYGGLTGTFLAALLGWAMGAPGRPMPPRSTSRSTRPDSVRLAVARFACGSGCQTAKLARPFERG